MTTPDATHETCGRCGYPKADHVAVGAALICPTALFLKDELPEVLEQP